ncbi:TolB-like protein/DNA-binding winged helix-turn-helix (wHTH) protein/Flp pilus assembly protein TadD [Dokdonella fugitiva]|uniref:TolB-like protein/DNA-binding winged helix-turn-helix (WHTH) protein/Flp pilus assembly protein TadD n=1 Tax=Dokdonella fugitiva TaxID=328517 RepID=A0A839F6R3_9GAMM|nr:winged helix-turn-helix domain-containing protein [Dokdonella fugitiva]MBA8889228.1 TolB-like protein/DNA-binding winged helix-turn-helix (wHTH) protein/Flp pilus assembly protein TadD [Dokdonella fugitiva]
MGQQNNRIHRFGPFQLEVDERRLSREGVPVALTVKQFDLLLALVEGAGHLRSRDELVETVWPDTIVEEHSLTSRVSALRKILGDEGETARYIETVRGRGYRFIADVADGPAPGVSPTPPTAPRPHRRALRAAALAIAVAAIGALGWHFTHVAAPPVTEVPARSIAVLPFASLSSDPENAYFASGVQDMILTRLAGIADLRVISRTSMRDVASRPGDLRAIGRRFGVATVLEGSVQKDGDRVLINVQLIDARTDAHLWAQAYTRPFANIFEIESDVATRVAEALQATLQPAEASRLARAPTADAQAYDLFLKAEYPATQVEQGRSNAKETFERAAELYRQAIARDPDFALAKARLAFLEIYAAWFGLAPADRVDDAERLAREALQADLPQAHLAMGYVRYWGRWDYAGALAEFEQAERALPSDAAVRGAIAFIHRRQGKFDDALAGLAQAQLRDPRNPLWFTERGNTLAQVRRYAEAEQEYNRALAVDPAGYRVVAYKALTHLCAGEIDAARATLANAPDDPDSTGVLTVARYRLAWLDRDAVRALAVLAASKDDWIEDPFMSSVPVSLLRANAHALAGDAAAARADYERAAVEAESALHERPRGFYVASALGLARAGLGQRGEAIESARRATEQMPFAADMFSGAPYLNALAETYARVGDADSAIALLRRLLDAPAGRSVSPALLQRDPAWDRIRAQPAFQALVVAHADAAPASLAQTPASTQP